MCKTVACHGGWAAVFFLPHVPRQGLGFHKGADALAKHLGFNDADGVEGWARSNRKLWGNSMGYYMFSPNGYEAFGFKNADECTLVDIAAHWASVGQRVLDQYLKSAEPKPKRLESVSVE